MDSPPTSDVCHHAVAQAAAARRKRAQQDPRFAKLTPSALTERITAVAMHPRTVHASWWLVGHVYDELADGDPEIEVWYHAADAMGDRRLRLVDREPAPIPARPKAKTRFCHERDIWVDIETGEPVNDGIRPRRW